MACTAGRYNPDAPSAADLPTLFAARDGAEDCLQCPGGFFQTSTASIDCDPCAAGTFQNEQNATQCKDCGAGRYSVSGTAQMSATVCLPCAPGITDENDGPRFLTQTVTVFVRAVSYTHLTLPTICSV